MKKFYRILLILLLILLAAATVRRYDRTHSPAQVTPTPEVSAAQVRGESESYSSFYYDQLSGEESRHLLPEPLITLPQNWTFILDA